MKTPFNILLVQGSLHEKSSTAAMLYALQREIQKQEVEVSLLDLRKSPLPLFTPGAGDDPAGLAEIQPLVQGASAIVLGTPDYHGMPSGAIKNFLDYFWTELSGTLFGYVCASHEKGLTAMDSLRVAVRQCYGWSLPYGVAGIEKSEIEPEGKILSPRLEERLQMMAFDLIHYGQCIHAQRERDLSGSHPGFLARQRNA